MLEKVEKKLLDHFHSKKIKNNPNDLTLIFWDFMSS